MVLVRDGRSSARISSANEVVISRGNYTSLSAYGNTLAIGANNGDYSGHVRVIWLGWLAELETAYDNSGYFVFLSVDGNSVSNGG